MINAYMSHTLRPASSEYDVVVIGAGSGGLTAAVGLHKAGKRVLLIEREHMGGECTNTGCIPSKALLHHAKTYAQAASLSGETTTNEAYRQQAFSYVRSKIDALLEHESPEVFRNQGIDVMLGEASFVDRCAVQVGETTIRYRHAIIATGSSPRLLDIPGQERAPIYTNQDIFLLSEIPKNLLIIGSGPIGMELGQAFAMLGSHVTIATRDAELGRLEDPALRPFIQESFRALGVTVYTNAAVSALTPENATLTIDSDDGEANGREVTIPTDAVLMAVGRVPNLPDGLDRAGIAFDERCVLVDRQYRTANKYVYAVGDVAQPLKFTHTADDSARQVATHIVSKGLLRAGRPKAVPKVTYIEPEVAQVGLSHERAIEKYGEAGIHRIAVPFTKNDRVHTDDTDGMLVVIARRLTGTVLGAHIVGPRAGELIAIFTLAIDQKISLWALRRTIFAYPTYALIIKKAADQFFATQLAELGSDLKRVAKKHFPKLVAVVFWSVLVFTFHEYRTSNQLSYRDVLFQLYDFFTMSMYGPLIYITLYALRPLIFFPATLLTALSGALFGFWWGVIYTIVGENASANFAYWIGRFFGNDLKLEDTVIGNWVEALRRRPFESVLFMRLFYFPFDLTNYGSGILKIHWPSYATATLIGIMPGLTTFVALGAAVRIEEFQTMGLSVDVFDPKFISLSVGIFVVSLLLSRWLKRWQAAKNED